MPNSHKKNKLHKNLFHKLIYRWYLRTPGFGPIKKFLNKNNESYPQQIHLFSLIYHERKKQLLNFISQITFESLVDVWENLDWESFKARKVIASYLLKLFDYIDDYLASELISVFSPIIVKILLNSLSITKLQKICKYLEDYDIIDILGKVPKNLFDKLLSCTNKMDRKDIYHKLKVNPNFLGSIMSNDFITFSNTTKIGKIINFIKKNIRNNLQERKNFYYIYHFKTKELIGQISIHDLFLAEDYKMKVDELVTLPKIKFHEWDDVEEVLFNFKKLNLIEAPIISENNVIIGVVYSEQIYDVSFDEFNEDFQRLAGIEPLHTNYMQASLKEIILSRLPWLIILMISATLSQTIIQIMQGAIGSHFYKYFTFTAGASTGLFALFAIDALIPVISGTAGNAGSQSSTTIIRNLATGFIKPYDYWKVIKKEFAVAFFVGLLISEINFFRMLIFDICYDEAHYHSFLLIYDWYIMIALFFSINITVLLSKFFGSLIPILLIKFKKDPSVMSAPLITTAVDALCNGITYSLCIAIFILAYRHT